MAVLGGNEWVFKHGDLSLIPQIPCKAMGASIVPLLLEWMRNQSQENPHMGHELCLLKLWTTKTSCLQKGQRWGLTHGIVLWPPYHTVTHMSVYTHHIYVCTPERRGWFGLTEGGWYIWIPLTTLISRHHSRSLVNKAWGAFIEQSLFHHHRSDILVPMISIVGWLLSNTG